MAIFTTREGVELSGVFTLRYPNKEIRPFSRDTLFLDIYTSCRHREHPVEDAAALTQTILGNLRELSEDTGAIERSSLVGKVWGTLKSFDETAAAVYKGLHPL